MAGRNAVKSSYGLLLLRLVLGFGFASHGYAKLQRGPEKFAVILGAMGVPQPHFMAWATSLLEFVGGVCVMLGAFVVYVSLPLAIVMLTAILKVHLQYGYSSIRLQAITPQGATFGPVGYELPLLYMAALVAVTFAGDGEFSVDGWLRNRR